MKSFSEYLNKTLVFIQPSIWKSNYKLMNGEEVIGTLEFPKIFSTNAKAEMFGKSWEIKKDSFWKSEYGIYKYGYELPAATATLKMSGSGTINIYNGSELQIDHHVWKSFTEVVTQKGMILFHAKGKLGFKEKHLITIKHDDPVLDDNPWLIMFIYYLAIARRHSGAVYYGSFMSVLPLTKGVEFLVKQIYYG